MCKNCENNFLYDVYQSDTPSHALHEFRKEYNDYILPLKHEVIVEGELIGTSTFQQYMESIEQTFFDEFMYKKREVNKLYVYTSKVLNQHNALIVTGIANKKQFACSSMNYMPGRRF